MRVLFGGKEKALAGPQLKVGDTAPDFKACDKDFKTVTLADYAGRPKIISVFPSIDTPVCSLQNRRMNAEKYILTKDVAALSISVDLPFAQNRFAHEQEIDHLQFLSDYHWADFGKKYGFLIEELRLLGRGLIVIDRDNKIVHIEYVEDLSKEPNYNQAIEALRQIK